MLRKTDMIAQQPPGINDLTCLRNETASLTDIRGDDAPDHRKFFLAVGVLMICFNRTQQFEHIASVTEVVQIEDDLPAV